MGSPPADLPIPISLRPLVPEYCSWCPGEAWWTGVALDGKVGFACEGHKGFLVRDTVSLRVRLLPQSMADVAPASTAAPEGGGDGWFGGDLY